MSTYVLPRRSVVPTVAARRAGHPVVGLFDRLLSWHERHRQRRALGQLDDHLLRDIGLNRATARMESAKAFWQD
jgi:uncharacterized protein YjiS (DUF1127 family)